MRVDEIREVLNREALEHQPEWFEAARAAIDRTSRWMRSVTSQSTTSENLAARLIEELEGAVRVLFAAAGGTGSGAVQEPPASFDFLGRDRVQCRVCRKKVARTAARLMVPEIPSGGPSLPMRVRQSGGHSLL